jgi:hypothetical protein
MGEKTSSASPASSGDVPCLGLSLMDAGRLAEARCAREGGRSDRPDAHTMSAAVADSLRYPRLQPPDDVDGDLGFSPCIVIAELTGECERRPVVGRADAEPSKVLRA